MKKTKLSAKEEKKFKAWYRVYARSGGIDPDPDNPLHMYDYRGAYKAGAKPKVSLYDGKLHWPSEFKSEKHPRRYVGGVDTKTGKKVKGETVEEAYNRRHGKK
jgi:hypothetical protein